MKKLHSLDVGIYGRFLQFVVPRREEESIPQYFLRVDARMKIVFVAVYWFLFGAAGLLLKSEPVFHLLNTGAAVFFYLYARRNIRGSKYYSIHFDLGTWLHLLTMNFVFWSFTPEAPKGTFWDQNGILLVMFVLFFSMSRYKDYRDAKYAKQFDREAEEYRQELARKRAAREVNEE